MLCMLFWSGTADKFRIKNNSFDYGIAILISNIR